ncbi:unnamed protein product, partial [Rangifer tarandus platyrhynchus]
PFLICMLRLLPPEGARLPRADSTLRTASSLPEPAPDPEPASRPPGPVRFLPQTPPRGGCRKQRGKR